MYGRLSHAAKLGLSFVQNGLRHRRERPVHSSAGLQAGVLPSRLRFPCLVPSAHALLLPSSPPLPQTLLNAVQVLACGEFTAQEFYPEIFQALRLSANGKHLLIGKTTGLVRDGSWEARLDSSKPWSQWKFRETCTHRLTKQ